MIKVAAWHTATLAPHPAMSKPSLARLLLLLLAATTCAYAQQDAKTVPALFLSDIHFDPFHDPARATQLAAAPIEEWTTILAQPELPDQPQAFAALQKACDSKAIDTRYALLDSTLQAIKTNAADTRFVTISGDLLGHQFDCRYDQLVRANDPAGYAAFVQKTIAFLMLELQRTLPNASIYMGMGNNDSACGDYRMDLNDPFLAATAKTVALGLPASERAQATHDFAATGEYAVSLPIHNTRLLVLDNIFLSKKYLNCAGKPDPVAMEAQLHWLKSQLATARRLHQRVWIMGHIPPGVDLYATMIRNKGICNGAEPATFLADDRLATLMLDYTAEIKLGIFGHTHQDELRLFRPEHNPAESLTIKMVSSITPVNGGAPTFTVVSINPATATLIDYRVFTASNHTGIGATWQEEYDYRKAYNQQAFDGASLTHLTNAFLADPTADSPESKANIANYLPGDKSTLIKPVWPQYACVMTQNTTAGFTACACPAAKP
jgi:sphingomyelin phosphodiesterase acid-like 3